MWKQRSNRLLQTPRILLQNKGSSFNSKKLDDLIKHTGTFHNRDSSVNHFKWLVIAVLLNGVVVTTMEAKCDKEIVQVTRHCRIT